MRNHERETIQLVTDFLEVLRAAFEAGDESVAAQAAATISQAVASVNGLDLCAVMTHSQGRYTGVPAWLLVGLYDSAADPA